MSQHLHKFQGLLRELFQFDSADLDFGIYRIMNHKRDVIEQFIVEKLPKLVADELSMGVLAELARIAEELENTAVRIRDVMGEDAIDGDGNLNPNFSEMPAGAKYNRLQARLAGGQSRAGMEATVFNHLYNFFSRYYEDGDFISKRRYSKRERYAIPYNGEEVLLHWANKDQYYVKTGEHFRNYRFKSLDVTVQFEVMGADIEQNNVKGEKRYFFPLYEQVDWDEAAGTVLIPFEFRPMSASEQAENGRNHLQEAIIKQAVDEIPKRLEGAARALAALTAERHRNGDDATTFLEYHLRQYTRRNAADFFIHKDLQGFLTKELDFYLKNEVVQLDGLETGTEVQADAWFRTFRLLKLAGDQIIDLLDQIESFQKMIWEKSKFVTDVQYCVALRAVDESLYPAIAQCESQWQEWRALLRIDEERDDLFGESNDKQANRMGILRDYQSLVLDTKHFGGRFVDELLGGIANLSKLTDGILVHGDNAQALHLLRNEYAGRVRCIHIDPPYNTQTSGFLYKNSYQHSSWLAMMDNHVRLSIPLLGESGSFICHIDENEYERLHLLLDGFDLANAGTIVWDKRNPMTGGGGIAIQHEYIVWRTKSCGAINYANGNSELMLNKAREFLSNNPLEEARSRFSDWVQGDKRLSGGERAYRHIDDDGKVYSSVSLRAPERRTDQKFFVPLIHPETGKPCPVPPNGFSRTPETLSEMLANGEILFGRDESTQPRQKRHLREGSKRQFTSVHQNARKGKADLDNLGLTDFPYCHATQLYAELLGAAADQDEDCVVDYFAGSGTTGEAVMRLNREDGMKRKFVLVEVGDHFHRTILPRMKKVFFAPEWKDGKPARALTECEASRSPNIIKYIRLESYEDALNNIKFDDTGVQTAMQWEDYLIGYMLRWETRNSATLLNVEQLSRPFDYRLVTYANGNSGTARADVAETFNYLIGLRVKSRRVHYDNGRRYLVYQGNADGRTVVVIWRETAGWSKEDYIRDERFVIDQKFMDGADEGFVNGTSFIPGAKALEPLFNKRMFAPLE